MQSVPGLYSSVNIYFIFFFWSKYTSSFINSSQTDIVGYIYMQVYLMRHFPTHLTRITLTTCRMKDDPMPILEKLGQPKEVYLMKRSFSWRIMVCTKGGFLQLQKLWFYVFKEWEEWIVEELKAPCPFSILSVLRIVQS